MNIIISQFGQVAHLLNQPFWKPLVYTFHEKWKKHLSLSDYFVEIGNTTTKHIFLNKMQGLSAHFPFLLQQSSGPRVPRNRFTFVE